MFRKCPLPGASNADGDYVSMTPSVAKHTRREDFSPGLRTLLVRRAPTEHTSISNIRFGSRGKKSWKTNSNAISRLVRRSSDLSRCGEIQIWTDRSVASSSNSFINKCRQAPSPEHQRSGVGHKLINSMTHWRLLPWHLYRTTPLCSRSEKENWSYKNLTV